MKQLKPLHFWILITIFYFATRLVNLLILPIFTDEAIYTYWAQVALHDPANRFISLEDGKQPLFIWLAAIAQKFIADPLLATRLVSVLSGFGSMVGIYLLSRLVLGEKIARLSSFLYIILPFTLLYDRMALFDSLLTMLGIYATFFSVMLAKELRLDMAILSAATVGLAIITKSSGIFFLYLLPASLLFFNFKQANLKFKLLKLLGFFALIAVLSQIIYNSLRLSPLFYLIERKNTEFIRSVPEVVNDPFAHFQSNMTAIISWVTTYNGWPLFLLFLASLVFGFAQRKLSILFLAIYVLAPFLAEALFNKVLYPRFVLFYFPYVIILTAYAVTFLSQRFKKYQKYSIPLFILVIIMPLTTSFKLMTNPASAKIAEADTFQYLNDWPAGFGVAENIQFFKSQPQDQKITVGTEGTFGLLPYAFKIYFYQQPNIEFTGYWPVDPRKLPDQVVEQAKKNKTYFVFNFTQDAIDNSQLKFISQYQKGQGQSFMRLYEVIPK